MTRGKEVVLIRLTMAAVVFGGCAHGPSARVAAMRDFARSLPACASSAPAMSVTDALARTWQAGDRLLVRGYLSVVAYGPPCDSRLPPGSDAHCGVAWTLWSIGRHPIEFANSVPGGAVSLVTQASAPRSKIGLPPLTDGSSDAQAAQRAMIDLDVTVLGAFPDHICRHEGQPDSMDRPDGEITIGTKCPRNDYNDCEEDCIGTLLQHPLTVVSICRTDLSSSPPIPGS